MAFGSQIRAALSPEIRYEYPVMAEADGQLMTAIPASAVWTGEDGERYAWRVSRSDEFPESTFVVNAVPVAVEREADGMVYFGYGFGGLSQSDAVAVDWPGTLKEGMCVRPGR
jgi:hypothetical protein